jgi:N-acetylglucosaminyldiphosphoundecaprenol N-acetyl-beta-D-mannosaminyltransferase
MWDQHFVIGNLPTITLRHVRLHAITERECIARILDELDASRGGVVVTPNVDHWRRLSRDAAFVELYRQADLIVADGMPLVWASRLHGTPLPERVAGSSLISTLSAAAAERGRSIYLLGGAPGTAEAAGAELRRRSPNLRIVGWCCPEFGFEKDDAAMAKMAADLKAAHPDIVYVGLGSPKQEVVAMRLRPHLPQAWWLGIGASFSFLSGHVPPAPRWMRRTGLEWIHRLVKEPRRLARRYLIEDLPFAIRELGGALGARLRHGDNGTW